MKETKIKTSSLSLTIKPGNKILVRSIFFLLSEKTKPQNKRWVGFNNNFDFDDCSHEHPQFSVPGKLIIKKFILPYPKGKQNLNQGYN